MKIALIPIYNEESTLLHVLELTHSWADHIVMVDDGSTDGSKDSAQDWQRAHPGKATLIALERNSGMAAALKAGLAFIARGLKSGLWTADDIVIFVDADDQYRDANPVKLCEYLQEKHCDLAIVRRDFSLYPAYKRFGNWLLSAWASCLCGQRIHDVEAGLRAIKVGIIAQILDYYTGWRYSCAQEIGIIAILLGFKVDNDFLQPVSYYRSRTRISHFLINSLMGLISALRVRFGFKTSGVV